MASEHIHVVETAAAAKQLVLTQAPLPPDEVGLEQLAAHLAQFQDTQFLLNIAGVLAEETGHAPQARTLDATAIELTSPGQPVEVWRIDGPTATIQQQQASGQYETVERSACFPVLTAMQLLYLAHHPDRARPDGMLGAFRAWVRKQLTIK